MNSNTVILGGGVAGWLTALLIKKTKDTLALGPGIFGSQSSIPTLRAMNGFANMAFFYRNILRLGEGRPTKRKMNLLFAFIKHQMTDAQDAKNLKR